MENRVKPEDLPGQRRDLLAPYLVWYQRHAHDPQGNVWTVIYRPPDDITNTSAHPPDGFFPVLARFWVTRSGSMPVRKVIQQIWNGKIALPRDWVPQTKPMGDL
jgi:hypothetical protein